VTWLALLLLTGAQAEQCDDRAGDRGASECWYRASIEADTELNRLWSGLRQGAREADSRFKPTPRREKASAERDLVAAQGAWVRYRDAECTAEAGWAQGVSLEPVLVGRCETMMTRQRIQQLKDLESSFREP